MLKAASAQRILGRPRWFMERLELRAAPSDTFLGLFASTFWLDREDETVAQPYTEHASRRQVSYSVPSDEPIVPTSIRGAKPQSTWPHVDPAVLLGTLDCPDLTSNLANDVLSDLVPSEGATNLDQIPLKQEGTGAPSAALPVLQLPDPTGAAAPNEGEIALAQCK